MYAATGGDDYVPGPFVVTIPTGDASFIFNISIIDDDIFEANESFSVTIDPSSLPSRVLVQPECVLMVTIVDDDGESLACIRKVHSYSTYIIYMMYIRTLFL